MAKSKKQRRLEARDRKAAQKILRIVIGIVVVLLILLFLIFKNS